MRQKIRNAQLGFTLTELLVATLMLVITVTIAIPSMRAIIQNNRITATTNDLVFSLNLARSEAIKRGVSVSICPTANDQFTACGNDWSNGWLIFVNPDENATFSNNASEPLIRANQVSAGDMNINPNPNAVIATYNSAGFASAGTGNLTFTVNAPDCTGLNQREVSVSLTGRVSTVQTNCP